MNVGVRELRDGLSRHLAQVPAGHVVTVTDHGEPVARIVPVGIPSAPIDCFASVGVIGPAVLLGSAKVSMMDS